MKFEIIIDMKPFQEIKRSLERMNASIGPKKIRKRVRSGELHPLAALDLLNLQRIAGGKPDAGLERWCEQRWQKKRCAQGRRSLRQGRGLRRSGV